MKKVIVLSVLFLCLTSVWSFAQTSYFSIAIDGLQANAGAGTGSAGMGSGSAYYDASTMTLTVAGNYSGLTSTTTVAHVHIAPTGTNGGVVFALTLSPSGSTAGNFSGSGTLDATQETALLSDGMYVNIHSSSSPSGEIRGQILLQPEPNSNFSIAIDGSQANAGVGTGSSGTGIGTATYDPNTMMLTVSGSYSGLTGTTTVAHVHIAPAGSNGGVVFGLTLSPLGTTSGDFYGSGMLDSTQEVSLLANGTYVNIHTSAVGSGEIRGQILLDNEPISNLSATLDGIQANGGVGTGSSGIGTGTATYDPNTMTLNVSGSFSGLTGNTTVAHVHIAPAGFNGGVVLPLTLSPSGSTSGIFSGSGTLTATQESALLTEGMYINVHSSTAPGGEIRGQLSLDIPNSAVGDSCLITWTNLQQTVSLQGGKRLRKNVRVPTGFTGAALSQNALSKNDDGWVQMEALRTDRRLVFGLAFQNTVADKSSIRFGIEIDGNANAYVIENGYRRHAVGSYQMGDIFRIEKANGVVKYYQNGIVVYTSLKNPWGVYYADASISTFNGTVYNAYSSFSCATSPKVSEPTTAYETNETVQFSDVAAYPNPFEEQVTINYVNFVNEVKSIEMYNMNGQHIRSIEISQDGQTTISTEDLASGFYIISINGTKNLKLVKF